MTNAAIDFLAIRTAAIDHALNLGLFEQVSGHEPKSSPGTGLSCAVWGDYLGPYAEQSGLAATTALLVFEVRVFMPFLARPEDSIDPAVFGAVAILMGEYAGDFDLAGTVESVDLLGRSGRRLEAKAGYYRQDGAIYRSMGITLPVIVNDVWAQVR
jgi:hypothetical protein